MQESIQLPDIERMDRHIQLLHLRDLHEAFNVPASPKLVTLWPLMYLRMLSVVQTHELIFLFSVAFELHHMIEPLHFGKDSSSTTDFLTPESHTLRYYWLFVLNRRNIGCIHLNTLT